jgi:hypothetical protein
MGTMKGYHEVVSKYSATHLDRQLGMVYLLDIEDDIAAQAVPG